jgi:hypothetical protein
MFRAGAAFGSKAVQRATKLIDKGETAAKKQAAARPIRELGARRDDFLVELFLVELMALVQK